MKDPKSPKSFSWRVIAKASKKPAGTIVCQEQCSSSGGGNGRCGNK